MNEILIDIIHILIIATLLYSGYRRTKKLLNKHEKAMERIVEKVTNKINEHIDILEDEK